MKIDLNDIKLFVSVVQAGSLTKAAELLNFPKSRLSRRLTELENALGTTLMDRTKKGIVLNELGTAFFTQAQEMVHTAELAVQSVQGSLNQPSGLLRMTVTADVMRALIAPHLSDYLRENPNVNLDVNMTTDKINLIQDGVDIAIRAGKIDNENVVARKLADMEFGLYATADYLAQAPEINAPNDLYRHSLLYKADVMPWQFQHNGQRVQINAEHRLSCNSFSLVTVMIAQDMGIGLLPKYPAFVLPHFVELLPQWQLPKVPLHALYYKQRGNAPIVRSMVEFLRGRLGD